jgi:hypothetical protein
MLYLLLAISYYLCPKKRKDLKISVFLNLAEWLRFQIQHPQSPRWRAVMYLFSALVLWHNGSHQYLPFLNLIYTFRTFLAYRKCISFDVYRRNNRKTYSRIVGSNPGVNIVDSASPLISVYFPARRRPVSSRLFSTFILLGYALEM